MTATELHPLGDAIHAQPFTSEENEKFAALFATGEEQFGDMTPESEETTAEKADGGLGAMLGSPEPLEDLWPGVVYTPPNLRQLKRIFPLTAEISDLFNEGKVLEAVDLAVGIIADLARRPSGGIVGGEALGTLEAIPIEEIEERFTDEDFGPLIHHILTKQGLNVKGGTRSDGSRIGLRSFQQYLATPDTPSDPLET